MAVVSGARGRGRALLRVSVSPDAFRLVALAAVVALALTIISGAAVRLTGSGLGCATWPSCEKTSVVAPLQYHAWVEFGNRLINALVTLASIGAFAAALSRAPRRRDLTWLSFGLVVGLLAEVVVGAVVVYTKLNPAVVSLHFLLGLVFLAVAVVLHLRSRLPDRSADTAATDPSSPAHPEPAPAGARPLVGPVQIGLARLGLGLLAVVVTLGTVVTSTGPHGGDPHAHRFHFSLHSVAQLHGTSVESLLAVTLLMMWSLARSGAPRAVLRRAQVLVGTMAAQAAVGYTQYLNHDPVGLVAVHVAGASFVVIAALHYYFGLWERDPQVAPVPSGTQAASGALA